MAISYTHYLILKELKARCAFEPGGRMLEIGKANFYGDMPTQDVVDEAWAMSSAVGEKVAAIITRRNSITDALHAFDVAACIYEVTIQPSHVVAIDGDPCAPGSLKLDLNHPIELNDQFDVVVNHGTAEHIFNIANVFRLMHDSTKCGGLMIHESPFTGWVDHGFYCLQPTLFWDLASANQYEIVGVWVEHLKSRTHFPVPSREYLLQLRKQEQLPDDSMLFVVFRKTTDYAFEVPMQGIYAGTVSPEAAEAWRNLR